MRQSDGVIVLPAIADLGATAAAARKDEGSKPEPATQPPTAAAAAMARLMTLLGQPTPAAAGTGIAVGSAGLLEIAGGSAWRPTMIDSELEMPPIPPAVYASLESQWSSEMATGDSQPPASAGVADLPSSSMPCSFGCGLGGSWSAAWQYTDLDVPAPVPEEVHTWARARAQQLGGDGHGQVTLTPTPPSAGPCPLGPSFLQLEVVVEVPNSGTQAPQHAALASPGWRTLLCAVPCEEVREGRPSPPAVPLLQGLLGAESSHVAQLATIARAHLEVCVCGRGGGG